MPAVLRRGPLWNLDSYQDRLDSAQAARGGTALPLAAAVELMQAIIRRHTAASAAGTTYVVMALYGHGLHSYGP